MDVASPNEARSRGPISALVPREGNFGGNNNEVNDVEPNQNIKERIVHYSREQRQSLERQYKVKREWRDQLLKIMQYFLSRFCNKTVLE